MVYNKYTIKDYSMSFLYASLITFGLSLLIVHGSIFHGLKEKFKSYPIKNTYISWFRNKLHEMSNCMLCASFWIGTIAGAYFGLLPWWNAPGNGGILVGASWLLNCLSGFLGNGSDPGRVYNIIVTEPVKIEKVENNKDINTSKDDGKVLLKG